MEITSVVLSTTPDPIVKYGNQIKPYRMPTRIEAAAMHRYVLPTDYWSGARCLCYDRPEDYRKVALRNTELKSITPSHGLIQTRVALPWQARKQVTPSNLYAQFLLLPYLHSSPLMQTSLGALIPRLYQQLNNFEKKCVLVFFEISISYIHKSMNL